MSGSDGFFLGRGQAASREEPFDVDQIAVRLKKSEVLAADADDAAYVELASQVVQHLGELDRQQAVLFSDAIVGKEAVERSLYLRELGKGAEQGAGEALVRLFTRRVGKKVFDLRHGVWTDRGLDPTSEGTKAKEHRTVEAYSDAYFALVKERPELLPYLSLGERVLVELEDLVFEIVPPAPEAEQETTVGGL